MSVVIVVQETLVVGQVVETPVGVTVPPTGPVVITTPADVGLRGLPGEGAPRSFESVAQNLDGHPFTLTRDDGVVSAITYNLGGGQSITKALNRDGDGVLTSITLSGDTPDGIELTKTLARDGDGVLTGVSYE
ncbi:MAG: hypothetical protein AAF556_10335 [Pseudomonadota bacterium]